MAPISMPCVPNHTRWLLMRCSSAMSTRIHFTRSGISRPSSFSTDEDEREAVGLRAEVIHALDERDHLLPLLLLGGLLDAGVEIPDGGRHGDDGLAIELQHQPQHAVRAGVLRPHVDGHRLGATSAMPYPDGRSDRASTIVDQLTERSCNTVVCTSCASAVRSSAHVHVDLRACRPASPPSRPVNAIVTSPRALAASIALHHVRRCARSS